MNTDWIVQDAMAAVWKSRHKLRLGQAVYNVARDRYPALVIDYLVGSDVDPFYDSSKIRAFLVRLTELCDRLH